MGYKIRLVKCDALKLPSALQESFDRDFKLLPIEPPMEKKDVSALEVLKAHYLISNYFLSIPEYQNNGVLLGVKNVNMLLSAVDRQSVSLAGIPKWKTPYEKAATLFFGLVKNHPFHDGNKRTAFLSLVYFLRKNDIGFSVNPDTLEKLTLSVASSDYECLTNYRFKENVRAYGRDDAVVYSIAAFLRQKTRRRNKSYKRVRWDELERALNRLGFYLGERHRNKVEIYHLERNKILGIKIGRKDQKVTDLKVDYPGGKCQIDVQSVKGLLRKLQIVGDRFDYDSIFEEEPLYCMIQDYEDLIAKLKDE